MATLTLAAILSAASRVQFVDDRSHTNMMHTSTIQAMRHTKSMLSTLLLLLILALTVPPFSSGSPAASPPPSPHNNNWAVLVSTSRFWFNYRHTSNALAMYSAVKKMGIPDSQILLLIPDEYACNPRNILPGSMFNAAPSRSSNLYSRDIEVDYRGSEVTVSTFLRILTGRHEYDATPRSKRLLTNKDSNIFIYMSGHGGNNFLKFQDNEELNAQDLRDAIQQMHAQERYRSILFMLDTCQAETLFWELNKEDTPNMITIGSSKITESSYSVSQAMGAKHKGAVMVLYAPHRTHLSSPFLLSSTCVVLLLLLFYVVPE